ncbi:MAG: DsbA family protein [Actinomycetota bacterium]|jgi:2-hydroxychromene-2-carboxylate isomerase
MTETVRFHFDPICPWAWQSSRWIRDVAQIRDITVDWRVFSLQLTHEGKDDPLADLHVKGTPALRTLALTRRRFGNEAVGRTYEAIGRRVHDGDEELDTDVVRRSLEDVGLDPGLVEQALEDDSTMDDVRADHDAAVTEVGAFGVPTIVLGSGRGLFGPVLATAPAREEAGELWDHVRFLIDADGFYELKRDRDRDPGERG